ncbi:A disintegrin and metalloproteinase with thrombospondin motifs 6-like [Actinia tenebrosa]|uniref:A disintegrin and metalloproteinase with thrombospondin motifs 6-like n=1 Tax=Actinia tenebrosa TaxID=6105 RepID=A0A6P8I610_ACTTE|nr:A disintegrin and metalloproteinase with thrombospondin motifs 6-like [Actinia tenebrosa]XP_031563379.1 A disintegrin and metalloproteinase with thrombospondin motifs 6-like [Actinia tenebrosa]
MGDTNVGYDYFYYKPGQGSKTTFVWRYKATGSCSATCAGGHQAQIVTCHRNDDESRVSRKFCDLGNKPSELVPCNTQVCPAKWEPELWQPCSRICGGGNHSRLVPCVQQVTSEIYRNVEYHYCNISARPPLTSTCNEVDCGIAWVPGEWSKCVIGKHGGTATREIKCQNILANGTVLTLNRNHCEIVGNMLPEAIMNCTLHASSHYVRPSSLGNLIAVILTCLMFGFLG